MSEYQLIHFRACDRPLDDGALEFMERQSTRADISRWEFTNEYHFGSFHGDAVEMLRRGYDVHLHFTNFGVRRLMFRLPELPCDKKIFSAFEVEDCLTWTKDKRGRAGILSIVPEADGGCYDDLDDVQSMLPRLVPLRDMLLRGDLRPLYLAWLACSYDEDSMEPAVPAGLGQLDLALEGLAEFYELPDDFLAAAAQQALPAPAKPDRDAAADRWIRQLPKAELKQIVYDLVTGNAAAVQADLVSSVRKASPVTLWPTTKPSRTLAQLLRDSESIETEREKREAAASERARKKLLKAIAADPKKTMRRIDSLVAERSTRSYHQAVNCLADLAAALGEDQGLKTVRQIAERLRRRTPRSNILIGTLRKRGWIE